MGSLAESSKDTLPSTVGSLAESSKDTLSSTVGSLAESSKDTLPFFIDFVQSVLARYFAQNGASS